MLEVAMASRSEVGQRNQNEDLATHGRAMCGWYAILADGAGGHQRGALASRTVVERIEAMLRVGAWPYSPESLACIVREAHVQLQGARRPGERTSGMHSTVVVLWVDPSAQRVLWAHVGDSRLYRLRRGAVDFVTIDDSLVVQLVDRGVITEAQAREHPQRNQLVAAMGIDGEIDPHVPSQPVELEDGDVFLLASDGWWDALEPHTLGATLAQAANPADWLTRMQERVEARQLPRQDNYSAVAVWVGEPQEVTRFDLDDTVPRVVRR